jgi:hypothetical protein
VTPVEVGLDAVLDRLISGDPGMSENLTVPPMTRLELVKLLRGVSMMAMTVRGRAVDDADRELSFTLGIIAGLADKALRDQAASENLTVVSPPNGPPHENSMT